ncbi:MAG TPA: phospholipase C, phosphocholine-specific [Rugosimonospora sp.]
MSDLSRRGFLGAAAAVTGAVAAGAVLPGAAQAHGTPKPSRPRTYGDIRDVKHVVILMQENRSFDHYFGSLKGVRGFSDRSTIQLPGGASVFQQPTTAGQSQYPWHMSDTPASGTQSPETVAQTSAGLGHSWEDQHGAWYGGQLNGWVQYKGSVRTMAYLDRTDIPFQYALADAYTVGDAYHCSVLSATGPNRTYLWSGMIDAAGDYGPTAFNGGDESNLKWQTYAEALQTAGVTWRVYQGSDNYGDNGLEYFSQFETAAPGSVLYENGVRTVPEPSTSGVTDNADNLAAAVRADVLGGTLPQVSWIVTDQAFSEHPDGAPEDGAYYVHGILKALNADPDVFNSTVVIIDYDENDGFFDHVPPPVAPTGTADEFYYEAALEAYGVTTPLPVGLGFRVPLLLVSPWTRGGWVTSEVSDHTSVIQFLEKWTAAIGKPARCQHISDWRRKVCGDLTNAFDFGAPVFGLPDLPETPVIGLDLNSQPTPTTNALPSQEPGHKRARPLPYQPNANLDSFTFGPNGAIQARLSFSNAGPHVGKASHFSVYDNAAPAATLADYPAAFPGQYTVDPSPSTWTKTVPGAVEIGSGAGDGRYDLTVVGPNRFLRHFTGDVTAPGSTAQVEAVYYEHGFGPRPTLSLRLTNTGTKAVTFTVTSSNYSSERPRMYHVPAHGSATHSVDPVARSSGWYDLSVTVSGDSSWLRRYVGHLETGADSVTG